MTVVDRADAEAGGAMPPATVRVWDPFLRVFHWTLVAAFAVAWFSAGISGRLHHAAGYVIVGLIVFRVVWGIVGPRHARFADFVRSPSAAIAFLRDTLRLRAPRHLGHNPAGGLMVVALLLALTAIVTTGIMMTTDAFWGVHWVRMLHELAVDSTLVLIALHVAGVVAASLEHRENLVSAMITGRKRAG